MKEDAKRVLSLFLRYIILVLAGMNLWLFYLVLTPLTVYPVFFLLSLFFQVSLSGISLNLNSFSIQLVQACIAGSAYFLLLILNLATPMPLKKRIFPLLFSFFALLMINILRIFLFSVFFIKSFSLFSILHLLTWYFLSALIVFLIWFVTIKIFKIEEIPVYSDLRFLYKKIKS